MKKEQNIWLVLSSAIVLAACDDKPKMTEQTKTTDQEKVTVEQPAHQLKTRDKTNCYLAFLYLRTLF